LNGTGFSQVIQYFISIPNYSKAIDKMQVAETIILNIDGREVKVNRLEDGTFEKPDYLKMAEREIVGYKPIAYPDSDCWGIPNKNDNGDVHKENMYTPSGNIENGKRPVTAPSTLLAKTFDGWNSRLKPAFEPIVVAMKPLDGTYAENAEKWGVSGIWLDGGRIGTNGGTASGCIR